MNTQKKHQEQDRYILRFNRLGHRASLKQMAQQEKRSLNKQILHLIDIGEQVVKQQQEAQQ